MYRLERLDHLAKKFRHKCDMHEQWSNEKTEVLKEKNFNKCRLDEIRVSCLESCFDDCSLTLQFTLVNR